jgi:hypothetical protein
VKCLLVRPHSLVRTQTVNLGGRNIGICIYNSAWRSSAGTGDDMRRLVISERIVDLALEQVANADFRIAVIHHPLDWLSESEQQVLEPLFFQKFDLYLCGHMHAAKPQATKSLFGHMVLSQCGTLFSQRSYFNGYQILDVDIDAGTIKFSILEWSERIRRFAPCTGLLPDTNGTITLQLRPFESRPEATKVESILRFAKNFIRSQANDRVTLHRTRSEGADDIKEVFVCPPLRHRRDSPGAAHQDSDVTLEDMLTSTKNYAIVGDRDAGKTSLGYLLAVMVSDGVCDKPRLPGLIDASAIPKYPQQIYGRIRRFLCPEDETYPKWLTLRDMVKSLRDLPALIIVDNVSLDDKKRITEIEALLAQLPDIRWMFLCTQDATARTLDLAKVFSTPTETLFMLDLPRRSIRELSRRRNVLDDQNIQRIFPKIMGSLAAAGLPKNGYIVSLLSWVATLEGGVDALNEASLVRTIVEHLLERGRFDSLLRGSFDPEFKEIMLSELAFYVRGRGSIVTYNEALRFTVDFFASRNLNFEADRVLRALQECRILDIVNGDAFFHLPCYLDYFTARYLRDNPAVLDQIRKSREHSSWTRELDLLTSLTRRDFGLLAEIGNELHRLQSLITLGDDAPEFSTYRFRAVFDAPHLRRLQNNKPSQTAIDDMEDNAEARALEQKSATPAGAKDAVNDAREYYRLLSLFGKVIRNAEAADGITKEIAVDLYMESQRRRINLVAKFMNDKMPELIATSAPDGKRGANDDTTEFARYLVHVLIPATILKLSAREIGTTKLLNTFQKNLSECTVIDARLSYALLEFDIQTHTGIEALRAILETAENAIVTRIIQMKLIVSYTLNEYDPRYQEQLEALIAEVERRSGTTPISVRNLKDRANVRTISRIDDFPLERDPA